MTLARQLLVGIVIAFGMLLAGIETIYIYTARHYLANQLDASANETATSLALSIGLRSQTLESSLVNTIVNPVFDRGYFQSIEVRAADGTTVFARRLESVEVEQPPAWFMALTGFDTPQGQSLISAGWKQLGRVIVQPHPYFAYNQLWETALATLAWLALLSVTALVGMRVYLSGILRPLQRIETAAVAIGENRFVTIDAIPRTRELQRVTAAINSLSNKVRDTITRESAKAELLRREAFEDPLTGRLNRRGFDAAASAGLSETDVFSGALVLVSLEGLEALNRVMGASRTNELLRNLADSLDYPNPAGRVIVGRWQGAVFAVLAENADAQAIKTWAEALVTSQSERIRASGANVPMALRAGIAHYAGSRATLASLAEIAEAALQNAIRAASSCDLQERTEGRPASDDRKAIEDALNARRMDILFQPVVSIPDERVIQYELFSRILDQNGQQIAATVFLPIAGQFRLLPALDRCLIDLASAAIAGRGDLPPTIALNVSLQSLADEAFRTWTYRLLEESPALARRMIFEISGAAAAMSGDTLREFAVRLRALGSNLALDNVEIGRETLAFVHEVMPAYLKLAPAYTREVGSRADARFTLEAMLRAFRPLGIPVYALGVEDRALIAPLSDMGLAGCQGYAIARPQQLS